MNKAILSTLLVASTIGAASADLYYIPGESQTDIPLRWTVGVDAIYDSNTSPTVPAGQPGHKDDSISINPFVGVTYVKIAPQYTLDLSGQIGFIYYFDKPDAVGSDDFYGQSHVDLNFTYRVNEQLRFMSRNHVSYELEPDYSVGVATTRQIGEYLYVSTDNAVGYRWTERLATYTGVTFTWLEYEGDVLNQDRFTWAAYNQFRYQISQQLVGTLEYRYANTQANDLASDYEDHFITFGAEYRVNPTTIVTAKAGIQIHDAKDGDSNTTPYGEAAIRTQINEAFSIRGYFRYSIEGYDTVREAPDGNFYNYDERKTFRVGVSGEYAFSKKFSVFGGVDYIPATFDGARFVGGLNTPGLASGLSEDVVNAYVGLNLKITDMLTGTVSYNFTDSNSDFPFQSYDRSRVSVGLRAEF